MSTNGDGYQVATRTRTHESGVSSVTTTQTISTPAGPREVTRTVTKPVPQPKDDPKKVGVQPILLDLDGDGIEISELTESTRFVADDTGLEQRMAWVSGGDGVLFIDADGNGAISNQYEYAFAEWAGGAADDLDGLRRAFDSNGDGKLTAADARWGEFRVEVTNADGSTSVRTLAELGITEINLRADATEITLADGSSIDGQTTFTINGVTRVVANATLAADAQAYRVTETVSMVGTDRVVVQTGYDAGGDVQFVLRSVTSQNGLSIVNSFDLDGDGTVDRAQTITTVINGNGSRTETVISYAGSSAATGVVQSRIVTTTSVDGRQVTIQRDSTGGGWFDASEVRTTAANGVRTVVISELAQNGAVIRSSTETISADGLVRTVGANLDGLGGADLITTETIGHNATTGARSEAAEVRSADGSLATRTVLWTSGDGRNRVTTFDVNGDWTVDLTRDELTTIPTAGGTATTVKLINGNGTLRSQTVTTVSGDGLSTTVREDVDGDNDFERTTTDVTVVEADGRRIRTIVETNEDGSVHSATRTVLGADLVSSETWVDRNLNGTFETSELVRQVTVDATTQARTTTSWDRNPDGTIRAVSVEVSNAAGTNTATTVDLEADGDIDRNIIDTTVVNGDQSATRTITVNNQDESRRSLEIQTVSANGLVRTISQDIGGTTSVDRVVHDVTARDMLGQTAVAGAVTRTVSEYAGNGTTLLSREITETSANRLTTITRIDTNGDGSVDRQVTSTETSSGAREVTDAQFHADGNLAAKTITSLSENGLVRTRSIDMDGDGSVDRSVLDVTALNANGSRERTVTEKHGDGSVDTQVKTVASDDGLTITTHNDVDGNGVWDRISTTTSVPMADGRAVSTRVDTSGSGAILSREQVETSDDGLVRIVRTDADGLGPYDLILTSTTVFLPDGSTSVVEELRDDAGTLRSKRTTTTTNDSRQIIVTEDINGDGSIDRRTDTVVTAGGATHVNTWTYAPGNQLISSEATAATDDGLYRWATVDRDGNGAIEELTATLVVNEAHGGTTTYESRFGADNDLISRRTTLVSDDGWNSTVYDDLDGNGDSEFVTQRFYGLASNGVETATTITRAENSSIIRSEVVTTSADGRTITTEIDTDGIGGADIQSQRIIATDGTSTTTTAYHSTSGALEARVVRVVSGDGLRVVESTDRDGDGRFDVIRQDLTELSANGDVRTETSWRSDRFVELGRAETYTSGDENRSTRLIDRDGDGVFEHRGETTRELRADGSVVLTQESYGATGLRLAEIVTTTSGNGLNSQTIADFNGDSATDRATVRQVSGTGAVWQETRLYSSDGLLREVETFTQSSDGRNVLIETDFDANGHVDRSIGTVIGLDQSVSVTLTDYEVSGGIRESVTETVSGNGHDRHIAFDIDGDGDSDITWQTDISYEADGDRVTTRTELVSPLNSAFGAGRTSYVETTIAAANGLSSMTTYDLDGDGHIDGQSARTRTIHTDGSTTDLTVTTYADGDLRARSLVETSANGRTIREESDFDGNGLADRIVETEIAADGARAVTETGFGVAGERGNTIVTLTSADGLETRIIRPDATQTITRSVLNDGSYTWNNGVTASTSGTNIQVSHDVDSLGIETWTLTFAWVQPGGFFRHSSYQNSVYSVRLDSEAKARVLDEAARLYDTILDRGMDFAEIETLVLRINNGQLDRAGLASEIITFGEFVTRYGTLSAAEYITQIYLNTLQRPPSLAELNEHLTGSTVTGGALSAADQVRIAMELAESAEHLAVGNGHLATNNFDVILNPAVFERSLDRAWVESIVQRLVDVVYDRDATAQEVETLSARLLNDTANPDDLVASLLQADGSQFQTATASLAGLTGAALVEKAFLNALGRQPTAAEQMIWEGHLAAGRLTSAQFLVSLALSVEQDAVGNTHTATTVPTVTTLNGTTSANALIGTAGQDLINGLDGNDTIAGGDGSDRLIGGTGVDLLWGGATIGATVNGSDTYVWAKGDGNDEIRDWSQSLLETDTLELINVASTEVTLTYSGAAGADLLVTIISTGEVIRIDERYQNAGFGYGIERIVFSDGVIWNLEDILQRASLTGDAAANTLTGTGYGDNIFGLDGIDTVAGGDGSDRLIGGKHADLLWGGAATGSTAPNGSDTYVWATGDGNDEIRDWSQSLTEIDTLELTNVVSSDVVLGFSNAAGADLLVTIISTGEVIRIDERYQNAGYGYGIERIVFSDGVSWSLDEILTRARFAGNDTVNTLTGTGYGDNIFGLDGTDIIYGVAGEDTLEGGLGNDSLSGGAGGDTYRWSVLDGNDTISDGGSIAGEIDRLELLNVNSNSVQLHRINYTEELWIVIGGELIEIRGYMGSTPIEQILFADGVVWTLDDMLARALTAGGSGIDILTGYGVTDNLYGFAGNDSLYGGAGDDYLFGGLGADYLDGGNGSDRYVWSQGDGSDTINDLGNTAGEMDSLLLSDVLAGAVTFSRSGDHLQIMINGTLAITANFQFLQTENRYGIEIVEYSDGSTTRVLTTSAATLQTSGTSGNDLRNGWAFSDIIDGLAGNDSLNGGLGSDTLFGGADSDALNGGSGNDALTGGLGVDTVDGGAGADRILWSLGDGADIITDGGAVASEVDTLVLTDVMDQESVQLLRVQHSWNLIVRVTSSSATTDIILHDWFLSGDTARSGIDAIEFADGTIWNSSDLYDRTWVLDFDGLNYLTGTNNRDFLLGLDGNDTIIGNGGNDTLDGGTGNDSLVGGEGADDYDWRLGDGNDTIDDTGVSQVETDTLVLGVAPSAGVALSRLNGSMTVVVTVQNGANAESISILNQVGAALGGAGIERLEFSDGTVWDLDRILAETEIRGNGQANSLTGIAERDNLFGLEGNDTLSGLAGNDWLIGGTGSDSLAGGTGSDTYRWAAGDGADTVDDSSNSASDTDTLELGSTIPASVSLHRVQNSTDMLVRITISPAEYFDIRVVGQFANLDVNLAAGTGLEVIRFSDGTEWTLADIRARAAFFGGTGNDTINGSTTDDRFYGGNGNDSLSGTGGNDTIAGGLGADILNGGGGVDLADYSEATMGVSVNLSLTGPQSGLVGSESIGDVLLSIEGVRGSGFADSILGDDNSNVLFGGAGDDTILGNDGFDQIDGGDGSDSLIGGHGADLLLGSAGNDVLEGSEGDDSLDGGLGDDALVGGAGADTFFGGSGLDLVGYWDSSSGLVIDIQFAELGTGIAEGDVLDGIERVTGSNHADTISGDASANLLSGHLGNDSILGRGGADTLSGDAGDDSLFGGDSDDHLIGGEGADHLSGGAGRDVANYWDATAGVRADLQVAATNLGSATGDSFVEVEDLYGSNFADSLLGDGQANRLIGNLGNDLLDGREGDDTLAGGEGADQLIGGGGSDYASYVHATSGLRADLQFASTNTGAAGGDLYSSVENLLGSGFGDVLAGDGLTNVILGYAGNDSIYGRDGNDILIGGLGADQLFGGNGSDAVAYWEATAGLRADLQYATTNTGEALGDIYDQIDNVYGTSFADVLAGDTSNNLLVGLTGNDALYGRNGNDTLQGDGGDDILEGGVGSDSLLGGDGLDTAGYRHSVSAVLADLISPTANAGEAAGDIYLSVENLAGSDFGDTLYGDGLGNLLQGNAGNDVLAGRSGSDTLDGGDGNDTLIGGDGADQVIGGNGIDLATFWNSSIGLSVDLQGIVANTGEAFGDVYSGVENLGGTSFNDALRGNADGNYIIALAGNDLVNGRSGNDTIDGGADNDTLFGDLGNDVLIGGTGADRFVFDTALGVLNVDTISDFSAVDDTIVLDNDVFLALVTTGNLASSAFAVGAGAASASHRIIYNSTNGQLLYDADGNGTGYSAVQFATIGAGLGVSAADFLVI